MPRYDPSDILSNIPFPWRRTPEPPRQERREPEQPQPKHEESSERRQENDKIKSLEKQVEQAREDNEELRKSIESLVEQLKKAKISTFKQLEEQNKEGEKLLIELAQKTPAARMRGINYALFGQTSAGKSTIINALLGRQVAETGYTETTLETKAYRGTGYTLHDLRGRNDDVSYLNMEWFAFAKGLTRMLFVITSTPRENSEMMKFLDKLNVPYDIIFNKFDLAKENERPKVMQKVRSTINELGLQKVGKVYFVSAENHDAFDDWWDLIDDLTG